MSSDLPELEPAGPSSHAPSRLKEGGATLLGLGLLALGSAVKPMGMLLQYLMALVLLALLWALGRVTYRALKRGLRPPRWRGSSLRDRLAIGIRGCLWLSVLAALSSGLTGTFFGISSLSFQLILGLLGVLLLGGVSLAQGATWSLTGCAALGTILLATETALSHQELSGETVLLHPPMRGDWAVIQGGSGSMINHHYALPEQRGALDLMRVQDGALFPDQIDSNADHFSWGEPLYAPADGKVLTVVSDMQDAEGWSMDPDRPAGNHVVVELDQGGYALLAHIQHGSMVVEEGQRVRCGDLLGRVGNTGNTTQPHIHFQVQTMPGLMDEGNRALPLQFRESQRQRGSSTQDGPAALRRGDRLLVPESLDCGGGG